MAMTTRRPRRAMTLSEHEAFLKENGKYEEWLALGRRQNAEWRGRLLDLARAQRPLVLEMRRRGYGVKSVWDLVNMPNVYDDLLPLLLDHLERPYPPLVRAGIARALAVKNADFAWHALLKLFESETQPEVRQGLANALGVIGVETHVPELVGLIRDTRHGRERVLLFDSLRRARKRDAVVATESILRDMADDKDLRTVIADVIRQRKLRRTRAKRVE